MMECHCHQRRKHAIRQRFFTSLAVVLLGFASIGATWSRAQDWTALREGMVAEIHADVIATRSYIGKGSLQPEVFTVLGRVPRHLFVDEALASRAYEDTALPIGLGQTISQPWVVARMTEAVVADPPDLVLERLDADTPLDVEAYRRLGLRAPVRALRGDALMIPGPRIVESLEQIAAALPVIAADPAFAGVMRETAHLGAGVQRLDGVGCGHPQIVVAMGREDDLVRARHPLQQHPDEVAELVVIGIANRVRDVHDRSTGVNDLFDDLGQIVRIGPGGVLCGIFHLRA